MHQRDLSAGVIAEKLITLLCRYLRKRARTRRKTNEGAPCVVTARASELHVVVLEV